jgi:hypothetical protein
MLVRHDKQKDAVALDTGLRNSPSRYFIPLSLNSLTKAEPTPGRLTRIARQLFTNLFRIKRKTDAKEVPLEFQALAEMTPSLPQPFTVHGNRVTLLDASSVVVPTKPVEFRRKPLKIPSQPRPPSEAMILTARYAAIESVEERAFQILVDLGMVEIHN